MCVCVFTSHILSHSFSLPVMIALAFFLILSFCRHATSLRCYIIYISFFILYISFFLSLDHARNLAQVLAFTLEAPQGLICRQPISGAADALETLIKSPLGVRCVCVCMCVIYVHKYISIYTYMSICIYIYMYTCMYMYAGRERDGYIDIYTTMYILLCVYICTWGF